MNLILGYKSILFQPAYSLEYFLEFCLKNSRKKHNTYYTIPPKMFATIASTGVMILPTQTMPFEGQIPQNENRFALLDPSKNG